MTADRAACPAPETIAAFVEGRLRRSEIGAVVEHLDRCPDCLLATRAANDFASTVDESRFRGWRTVLSVAAAVVAILIISAIVLRERVFTRDPDVARLVKLAPTDARTVEPRLSGGFSWAPYRGPERASGGSADPRYLRLAGAAGEAAEHAEENPTAEAQHTAALAMLLIDQTASATERLREVTKREPENARAWSDLAAAEYAVALRLEQPSHYAEALNAVDHALRLDPKLAEARFNRALILERLGLTQQARDAWRVYLEHDSSSAWAREANAHLRQLPSTTTEDRFRRERPRLEGAAAGGDTATVADIVARYPLQSRAFAEAEYLGQWGEAFARGDVAEQSRSLAVARAVGHALAVGSGETLLRDAVATIDAGNDRATIAEAHRIYRKGRIAFSRHEPAAAVPDLRRAASLFDRAGNPMALVARYYAASARFDEGFVSEARGELERGLGDALQHPGALALAAQIRWQISLCFMLDGDWDGALPHVTAARDGFERLGEGANHAFLENLLADTLMALGRADESWSARIRAFAMQSVEGRGDRLAVSIDGAARTEVSTGRLDVARALVVIAEAIHRAARNDVLLTNNLVRQAILDHRLGNAAAASRNASEAAVVAQRIDDPGMRKRALTDAAFASGALLVDSDPRRAMAILGDAIDAYREIEKPLFLPECHLLRARAARNAGDDASAAIDLEQGIATMERHRVQFAESIAGRGVFDAHTALFHEAIRLHLDGGRVVDALGYAERSRAKVVPPSAAFSIAELQSQLEGSDAVVLELVALPDEIAGFVVTHRAVSVQRRRLPRSRIATSSDEELYDVLIRPHEPALAQTRTLIVVADRTLADVAFAALVDRRTKQRLVERMAIAMAPDGASLRRADGAPARHSVVAVSLPAKGQAALAESRRELQGVASRYGRSITIPAERATFPAVADAAAHADVIHIAGHTERQPGAGDPALVFADARVSWRSAAGMSFDRDAVVVLAACETLRMPQSAQSFSLRLGDGFLAAGAASVIGTLYPISDNEARTLFDSIHRQLAARVDPAEAVRRAQIEALTAGGRSNDWRALAVLTRQTR